jgi:hypothetical protein
MNTVIHVVTKQVRFSHQDETQINVIQGAAFNVTHFESRITHLLYTAKNITEHG